MDIVEKIKREIRDIPDFPKKGIIFKDITPLLLKPKLCKEIVDTILENIQVPFDYVVGVESRGFLLGMPMALKAGIPFVPARKKGKLPGETESCTFELEYGTATLEMHKGHIKEGAKVLIHDDLLATGGTALAAAELVKQMNAKVVGFSFLINLSFLKGEKALESISQNIYSTLTY